MRPSTACIATFLLLAAPAAAALGQAEVTSSFSDERLEEIAAPVALYPDALLMQVFMAATYPLEVVEAERWTTAQNSAAICTTASFRSPDGPCSPAA